MQNYGFFAINQSVLFHFSIKNIFFPKLLLTFPNFFLYLQYRNNKKQYNMPNRRDLKKTINYICSELFAECVAASLYNGNPSV